MEKTIRNYNQITTGEPKEKFPLFVFEGFLTPIDYMNRNGELSETLGYQCVYVRLAEEDEIPSAKIEMRAFVESNELPSPTLVTSNLKGEIIVVKNFDAIQNVKSIENMHRGTFGEFLLGFSPETITVEDGREYCRNRRYILEASAKGTNQATLNSMLKERQIILDRIYQKGYLGGIY